MRLYEYEPEHDPFIDGLVLGWDERPEPPPKITPAPLSNLVFLEDYRDGTLPAA